MFALCLSHNVIFRFVSQLRYRSVIAIVCNVEVTTAAKCVHQHTAVLHYSIILHFVVAYNYRDQ